MLTAADYFGGATKVSLTGSTTIDRRFRVWAIDAVSASPIRTVSLPNVLIPDLPFGTSAFVILNVGNVNFQLAGTGFTTFTVTSSPRKGVIVVGVKLSDGQFRWNYDVRNIVY